MNLSYVSVRPSVVGCVYHNFLKRAGSVRAPIGAIVSDEYESKFVKNDS